MPERDAKAIKGTIAGADSVAEEIAAEVADHLTAATEDLEKEGIDAADARKEAIREFGDIRAVEKSCYWVWQGESIMFRWSMVALLSLLVIVLGITTVGSWRVQSLVAGQVDKMSEELANLAKTQEALQRQQEPLEIVGQIYRGDRSHPVANAEVVVTRVGDGEVVRRISADDRGRYRTGRLAEGDYSVVTKKVYAINDHAPIYSSFSNAQGPPIYLYSGDGTANGDLDIGDPPMAGPIKVRLSHPLPTKEVPGKYRLQSAISLDFCSKRLHSSIWTSSFELPKDWPIYCMSRVAPTPPPKGGYEIATLHGVRNFLTMDQFQPKKDVPLTTALIKELVPAGECTIIARILVDIEPLVSSETPEQILTIAEKPIPLSASWTTRTNIRLGEAWARSLMGPPNPKSSNAIREFNSQSAGLPVIDTFAIADYSFVPKDEGISVVLSTGVERQLQVSVPKDLEEKICAILDVQAVEANRTHRMNRLADLKNLLSLPAKVSVSESKTTESK